MKQLQEAQAALAAAVSAKESGEVKLLAALRCVDKLEQKLLQVCGGGWGGEVVVLGAWGVGV